MYNLKLFLKSAIHLGQKTKKWNPRTSFLILGNHDNFLVVDLHQTFFMFRRAFSFIQKICKNRGMILYISSSPIEKLARPTPGNGKRKGERANERKEGGEMPPLPIAGVTNFVVEETCRKNLAGEAIEKNGTRKASSTSKTLRELSQPALLLRKKRLERFFIPEALFILNPEHNRATIREALKLQIPIIAVIDTNASTLAIQYPIPGNNVSQESLSLYTKFLMHSIAFAKKQEIKQICG